MSSYNAEPVNKGIPREDSARTENPWSATAAVTGHASDWLLADRLLTADIRVSFTGAKSLEVVRAGYAQTPPGAASLFGGDGKPGWLREIRIRSNDDVLIHAVSFAPAVTVNTQPWLATLEEKPLGDALNAHGAVRREPMHFCPSVAVPGAFASDCRGWARRSIFDFDTAPLLLVEHLTPILLATPRRHAHDA